MGHITSKNYLDLQKRLDDAAQGVPLSQSLFEILKVIFTEEEAKYASKLPLNFFTHKDAMKIWNKDENETKKILENLAQKGFLFDFKNHDYQAYWLAPPMPGFFEFTLMRTDGKFNTKILSELFYQYMDKEDDFLKQLMNNKPSSGRVIPQKEIIKKDTEVLNYEKSNYIIDNASECAVGRCYCRHKKEHLGHKCAFPQETCLSFNKLATNLIEQDIAKKITKQEAKTIIENCMNLGMVQTGDNIQNEMNVICNCCSCCCEVLDSYKRFGYTDNFTSNFIIAKKNSCIGCGICVNKCPVNALSLKTINGKKIVQIDKNKCIGCGVCGRFCPTKNLSLVRKEKQVIVPKDTFERVIIQAIDAGKLQNYIFDNYNSITHQILKKFLKTLLQLKPAKMLLAKKQLQSIFLNTITKTKHYEIFSKLYYDGSKIDYSHKKQK